MKVKCPSCDKEYLVEDSPKMVGAEIFCKSCSTKFKVENPNLMPCPACFGSISKTARTCPHCGCEIAALSRAKEEIIAVCNPSLKYYFWSVIFGIITIPIGIGIFILLWIWIKNKFTSYEITNLRIIVRTGFIAKLQNEIWIKDMRGVNLVQSFWERIFCIGNILIGTAATENTEICMTGIPNPQKIVDTINKLRNSDR